MSQGEELAERVIQMESIILRGISIGMLFGMPVGAVGAMTVQRTLHYNMRAGLMTGLGSSVADCFYAVVGAFGLTVVSDFLLEYQMVIHAIGGILILLMGLRLVLRRNETPRTEMPPADGIKMFLTSFAVGITNPAAILTFLFAFSYFEIPASMDFLHKMQLVAGVFLGTYFWWGILSAGVSLMKRNARTINMTKINRVFGVILMLFGIVVFVGTSV